jgi:hypothetical protein
MAGTDFGSLKMAKEDADAHFRATGHQTYLTENGAFCRACDWHYIALQIDMTTAEDLERLDGA